MTYDDVVQSYINQGKPDVYKCFLSSRSIFSLMKDISSYGYPVTSFQQLVCRITNKQIEIYAHPDVREGDIIFTDNINLYLHNKKFTARMDKVIE